MITPLVSFNKGNIWPAVKKKNRLIKRIRSSKKQMIIEKHVEDNTEPAGR